MGEGTTENSGDNAAADDEIERQLRALMDEATAEPRLKEPGADERQKLAGQARKQAAKTAKKTIKQAHKQRRKTRGRGRSHKAQWAWTVAIIVLAGTGIFAYSKTGHTVTAAITGATGTGGPDDTQLVTNGTTPTSATSSAVSPLTNSGPPSDPFSGTPADKWANGAAGIVIPKAEPIGDYSADQVGDAYETTRKLLIAATLDKQTLDGGAPTDFADLLTQQERTQFLGGLDKTGLDNHGEPLSARGEIVQFAPGTTKLIGPVIKVYGTMTARSTTDSHGEQVLEINLNYRVAYAVEPPREPADWMRIVAQFVGPVDFGDWAGADSPFEPWWGMGPGIAGGRCGMKDGFIHPDYPNGPVQSVAPSGPAIDPYSLGDKPGREGCGTTTGT
jgi:hypothetical protein